MRGDNPAAPSVGDHVTYQWQGKERVGQIRMVYGLWAVVQCWPRGFDYVPYTDITSRTDVWGLARQTGGAS